MKTDPVKVIAGIGIPLVALCTAAAAAVCGNQALVAVGYGVLIGWISGVGIATHVCRATMGKVEGK